MKYSVADRDTLYEICLRSKWCKDATSNQWEKIFDLNGRNFPIEEVATAIWMCSPGWYRKPILCTLKRTRTKYLLDHENSDQILQY